MIRADISRASRARVSASQAPVSVGGGVAGEGAGGCCCSGGGAGGACTGGAGPSREARKSLPVFAAGGAARSSARGAAAPRAPSARSESTRGATAASASTRGAAAFSTSAFQSSGTLNVREKPNLGKTIPLQDQFTIDPGFTTMPLQ